MDRSEASFVGDADGKGGFLEVILNQKRDGVDEADVRATCKDYGRMMGLLDTIWASVGGIDSGLLPTDAQKNDTKRATEEGKQQWIKMGLTTLQPKWHLTFDGHLWAQHCWLGGLVDKADDSIEAFHQILKRLRERFRTTRSYKMKETCIRRELRRQRCPKIRAVIDRYEKRIKQSTASKRSIAAQARQQEKKRVKLERRISSNCGG